MDVDIDTQSMFRPEDHFRWTRASVVRDGKLTPHPAGLYPQAMPADPITGLAAIPYQQAEELGYSKVDFLHLRLLDSLTSRQEVEELVTKEPDWSLLQAPSVQSKLFQLSRHSELVSKLKPRSIQDVADAMALIRPGKKALLGLYLKDKEAARRALYSKDESGYSFKLSHAIAYALNVVLQLHLIEQRRL